MFHAVGITPEAPTLEAATGGADVPQETVSLERLRLARDELTTANGDELAAVCVGTPHASLAELEWLAALLAGRRTRVPVWVNTGRDVLANAERLGVADSLTSAGVNVVTDTCTYIAPLVGHGPVMTDSAKWAWYAPANIGVRVTFGSLEECVRSAIEGHVVRDAVLWGDA
jgi:predicted aconitase